MRGRHADHWRMRREEGQTQAEYAIVISVITAAIMLAIAALAGGIANLFEAAANVLS
jgi:Flp pilus assembly pilin Flp